MNNKVQRYKQNMHSHYDGCMPKEKDLVFQNPCFFIVISSFSEAQIVFSFYINIFEFHAEHNAVNIILVY